MTDSRISESEFMTAWEAVRPTLRGYCLNLARNPSLAEDIEQETFLKAWKARNSFHDPYTQTSSFSKWICRIARNIFLTEARKEITAKRHELGYQLFKKNSIDIADPVASVMDLADIEDALADMPEEMSTPILLFAQGYSHKEIAKIVGIGVGTIKSRISRGRDLLNQILEKYPEPPLPEEPTDGAEDNMQAAEEKNETTTAPDTLPPQPDSSTSFLKKFRELPGKTGRAAIITATVTPLDYAFNITAPQNRNWPLTKGDDVIAFLERPSPGKIIIPALRH